MTAATKPRFIRADGPDKVTGSGRYTADLTLTGMLAAKFRYADIAHARITKLDVSAARAIPGVMAILTADDVPDVRFGPFVQDRTLFARDVVRFEDNDLHGLENTGECEFEYLSVTAPPLNFRGAYGGEGTR